MHEWSLAQELVDAVCAQARDNGVSRVTKVRVDLGGESRLTDDSLRFCFGVLSKETPAGDAELELAPSVGRGLTLISLEGE
jgi:hydrogenase nickel incorporation protein HypA/HybF